MTRATAVIGKVDFATTITVNGRTLQADEPADNGGGDTGFAPYDLLLSALGACTAITLRMYAEHKGWDVRGVQVDLHFYRVEKVEKIDRAVIVIGDLSAEQRTRLAEICERTPVTLTLKSGLEIATTLA